MELLISHIKDEQFAFNLENIQEVIERKNIELLPNSPEFLEGVFNYRKRVIPVFNLRKLMGLKTFHQERIEELSTIKNSFEDWILSLKKRVDKKKNSFLESQEKKRIEKWLDETLGCMKCNNKGFNSLIKNHFLKPFKDLVELESRPPKTVELEELKKSCLAGVGAMELLEKNIDLLSNAFLKLVIFKVGIKMFGIIIDDIDRIVNVEKEDFKSADVKTYSHLIKAQEVIEIENRVILILNFDEEILGSFDTFKNKEEN